MECKIELIFVPVTDVDAAIDFYVNKVGFTLDRQTASRSSCRTPRQRVENLSSGASKRPSSRQSRVVAIRG